MFNNIKGDMKRYTDYGGWYKKLGFWVTLIYRFGSWTKGIKLKILRLPFYILYLLLVIPIRFALQVEIAANAIIGSGLLLEHPHSIIISGGATLGKDCTIFHEVTFGKGSRKGEPTLSDNVVVFPGAKVLGGINIGEHAHIGPNTVVMENVGSWVMVMVPKTRQIPMAMSKAILKGKLKKEEDKSEKLTSASK